MATSQNTDILLTSNTKLVDGFPMGLGYLHACLETQGFFVKSIFLNDAKNPIAYLEENILSISPSIIGIQIMTPTRQAAFETIDYIHEAHPKIKIVVGGMHATALYKQILSKYPFVVAVLGEAETTIVELAHKLIRNEDIRTVAGIAFKDKTDIVKTKERELIKDIDHIPFPKHELYLGNGQKNANILTTRGCPYNCIFCCMHLTSRKKVRFRSVENIMQELECIKQMFPAVEGVAIYDDTFLLDYTRVIHFCNEIIKRKFKFKFSCFGRFTKIPAILVEKLAAAGFMQISFGLESANRTILRNAHKDIAPEEIINTIHLFSKTNIHIRTFIIVGLPGETLQTIKETGKFIQKLQKINYLHRWDGVHIARVYPGTDLFFSMQNAGLITEDIWLKNFTELIYTSEHSEQKLIKLRQELYSYISLNYFFTIKGFFRQLSVVLFSKDHKTIFALLLKKALALIRN